jgi:hypothetical protein
MKNWGLVVTGAYFVILLSLLLPVLSVLFGGQLEFAKLYGAWGIYIFVGFFTAAEGLLLFLSADVSRKKLKPRTHIAVTCILAAFFTAVLVALVPLSLGLAWRGDKLFPDDIPDWTLFVVPTLWVVWSIVFYMYLRGTNDYVSRLISWLLKGSVLELLVAVPCHVLVRRRDDCCAPVISGWGIVTGIAIMLLAFGPSLMFLVQKRLEHTRGRARAMAASAR